MIGDIIKKLYGHCDNCGAEIWIISREGYRCMGKIKKSCACDGTRIPIE